MTLLCATTALLLALSSPNAQEAPTFLTSQTEEGAWRGDETIGDVGTTSLFVLALLGSGNASNVGPQAEQLRRGLTYLTHQDPTTSPDLEAIWRTWALCEAAFLDPLAFQDTTPQKEALSDLLRRRKPHQAFQDERTTTWAGFALASAQDLGLEVPEDAQKLLFRRVLLLGANRNQSPSSLGSARRALFCRWCDLPSVESDELLTSTLRKDTGLRDLLPGDRMLVTYAAYQVGGEAWKLASNFIQASEDARGEGATPLAQAGAALRAEAFRMLVLQAYFRYARIQGAR